MNKIKKVQDVIRKHKSSGRYEVIKGIRIFALDKGSGEVVFCIHGVPTSSFLYRKVVEGFAARRFRGVAIDLPGLGLSDRPEDFDYSFSNFAGICEELLKELKIYQFHLIIHDIGAPVGLALAAQNKNRIKSITVLNSMLDIKNFRKPLPMRPFEKPVLGEAELATMNYATWSIMLEYSGLEHTEEIPEEELDAYIDLLKKEDGGKAFLKIMRNFEQTEELNRLCFSAIKNPGYPVQIIWGKNDRLLPYEKYGKEFEKAASEAKIYLLEGKHLVPEEFPDFIVDKVIKLASNQ